MTRYTLDVGCGQVAEVDVAGREFYRLAIVLPDGRRLESLGQFPQPVYGGFFTTGEFKCPDGFKLLKSEQLAQ